jgi:hypothetical protein
LLVVVSQISVTAMQVNHNAMKEGLLAVSRNAVKSMPPPLNGSANKLISTKFCPR